MIVYDEFHTTYKSKLTQKYFNRLFLAMLEYELKQMKKENVK